MPFLYQNKPPDKFLQTAEKQKKQKYLEACLQKLRHFSPCTVSVGGLLVMEAETTLKHIVSHLATKWKHSYSRT